MQWVRTQWTPRERGGRNKERCGCRIVGEKVTNDEGVAGSEAIKCPHGIGFNMEDRWLGLGS